MIRINLLPADIGSAPSAPINPAIPLAICAAIPILAIAMLHPMKRKELTSIQTDIKKRQQELDTYQAIVRQIQDLEGAKSRLNNRKGIIQSLEGERLRYPQFMEDCVRMLPGNLWFTTMTTLLQPNGAMRVSMSATALDHYAVADFIANLENSQVFTEIDLGTVTSAGAQSGGQQQLTFQVTALYKKVETVPDAAKKS